MYRIWLKKEKYDCNLVLILLELSDSILCYRLNSRIKVITMLIIRT